MAATLGFRVWALGGGWRFQRLQGSKGSPFLK